jgi:hypothetical protein
MPQPALRTPRLVLVPLADRHLDMEVELDSDPEVRRFVRTYGSEGDTEVEYVMTREMWARRSAS